MPGWSLGGGPEGGGLLGGLIGGGLLGGGLLGGPGALGAAGVPPNAAGKVASVNGSNKAGTCGQAKTAGTFTLTTPGVPSGGSTTTMTVTVDVTASTVFKDPATSSASFANVCVGDLALAAGSIKSSAIAAAAVVVANPGSLPTPPGALGRVQSVNNSTASTACGVAGSTGSFALKTLRGTTVTVDVTKATSFFEPGQSKPSFAGVCVGRVAGALGTVKGSTVTAAKVGVLPAGLAPGMLGHIAKHWIRAALGGRSAFGVQGLKGIGWMGMPAMAQQANGSVPAGL
jgi:hypothetical protein